MMGIFSSHSLILALCGLSSIFFNFTLYCQQVTVPKKVPHFWLPPRNRVLWNPPRNRVLWNQKSDPGGWLQGGSKACCLLVTELPRSSWLWFPSVAVTKALGQSHWGRKGFAFYFQVPAHHGWESEQELEQELGAETVKGHDLAAFLRGSCFLTQPWTISLENGSAHSGLDLLTSMNNQENLLTAMPKRQSELSNPSSETPLPRSLS